MRIHPIHLLALAGALFLAQGCESAPLGDPRCSWEPEPVDVTAAHTQYVVDSIEFGATPGQSTTFGVDLDCDPSMRHDNVLGQALSTVYSALDTDLDMTVADMTERGRILHLIDVQASALDHASGAGVQIFIGEDQDGDPSDNFSGTEPFSIAPGPFSSAMSGRIEDGALVADFGDIPLQIALPGVDEEFVVQLTATRIEANVYDDHMEARVGGVLSVEEIETKLLPVIHLTITQVLESECAQGVCPADSRGAKMLDVLDDDDDGAVPYQEFHDNALVQALLAPDLDLYDQDGQLAPGGDGVPDSLSLGVSITAVRATF